MGIQFLKQEVDGAWRDFLTATEGFAEVANIRDAVSLRQVCEHRLSAFHAVLLNNIKFHSELEFLPERVSDGFVNYGVFCRARWVQGMEWLLKLQALINELCQRRGEASGA